MNSNHLVAEVTAEVELENFHSYEDSPMFEMTDQMIDSYPGSTVSPSDYTGATGN